MKKFISICLVISLITSLATTVPISAWNMPLDAPPVINDQKYQFTAIRNGEVLLDKPTGRLPAMGWNSWHAFASDITEEKIKETADAFVTRGLDKAGYEYIVVDDGCYPAERVNGKLTNNTAFPSGFKVLSDYIHSLGLKYGMYSSAGVITCQAQAGLYGNEDVDAQSFAEWGVDYLKIDFCGYPWDVGWRSAAAPNQQYVYAPRIRSMKVSGNGMAEVTLNAVSDGIPINNPTVSVSDNYVERIGTDIHKFPHQFYVNESIETPYWRELQFNVAVPADGTYDLVLNYSTGNPERYTEETSQNITAPIPRLGRWVQIAIGPEDENEKRIFDGGLPQTDFGTTQTYTYVDSPIIKADLKAGENIVRLMNHRRQETSMHSYAAFRDGLNKAGIGDITLSLCEWGQARTYDWGYKVGHSWRTSDDITYNVGPTGRATWGSSANLTSTTSIMAQYNKTVMLDEYSGLDRGWNDPDMLVIGSGNVTEVMARSHMTMWCMMNAPLMLGFDLRDDALWEANKHIVLNADVIALNQDPLGIQCKRIYSSLDVYGDPSLGYIANTNRIDVLAKPLENGDVALTFVNCGSGSNGVKSATVDVDDIIKYIGKKMVNASEFENAKKFVVKDLWTKTVSINDSGIFSATLPVQENLTIRITPLSDTVSLKNITPDMPESVRDQIINLVIAQLTIDEKVNLLGGTKGNVAQGTAIKLNPAAGGTYTTARLKEMGIPPMTLCDGPAGVNTNGYKATAWASPTALASTWNVEAMRQVGIQTGKEATYYGVDFMLAPAHDILRNPLSGRNFEYYSEDPLVSGKIASAYTKGVQSEGVGVTLKHYAANEQESFQNGGASNGDSTTNLTGNTGGGNAIISERALREIYLKSFQIPVEEADPWGVMASYTTINDVQAHSNKWLLTDVLRSDWGFKGFVTSDWGGGYSGILNLLAQMDLCEPSLSNAQKTLIKNTIAANKTDEKDPLYPDLTEEILDRSVFNILGAVVKSNIFNGKYGEWGTAYDPQALHDNFFGSDLRKESNDVARKVAEESIVLLKNTGNVLPLKDTEKVGIVSSPNLRYYADWGTSVTATEDFVIRGAGSSGVYVGDANPDNSNYSIPSLGKVLTERGKLAGTVQDIYEAAGRTKTVTYTNSGNRTTNENRSYTNLPAPEVVDANLAAAANAMAASDASHGIMIISRQTGEGYDNMFRPTEEASVYQTTSTGNAAQISKSYYLSSVEEKALKAYASALHEAGKKFIVMLNVGAAIDTTIIDQYADAVLLVWYPGQEGANVMTDVLYGAVNPSGKTTQTFLKDFYFSPSVAAAKALEAAGTVRTGLKVKNALSGLDTNGGWGTNPVFYDEGVLVGYRWFDEKFKTEAEYNEKVAYPFGYGLSYTDFEFSDIRLDKTIFDSNNPDETITATVNVKNIGDKAGKEVVQMYLGMHGYESEGRPMKDLRGFDKIELAPGEDRDITFTIKLSDLQYFDDTQPAGKILSGSAAGYQTVPTGDAKCNVEYGVEGSGWKVAPGSVFDVIIGNTSNNFELKESGVSSSFVVDYGVIFKSGNDTVKSIEEAVGKTLTAEVTVSPDEDVDYVVCAALYAADGSLIGLKTDNLVTEADIRKTITVDIDVPEDIAALYKLFIWDGKTYIPVCMNYEIK